MPLTLAENVTLDSAQLSRLINWLADQSDMANANAEKFYGTSMTYGDSEMLASDVERGKEEAFEEVFAFIQKQIEQRWNHTK